MCAARAGSAVALLHSVKCIHSRYPFISNHFVGALRDLDFPAGRLRLYRPGDGMAAAAAAGLTEIPAAVLNETGEAAACTPTCYPGLGTQAKWCSCGAGGGCLAP